MPTEPADDWHLDRRLQITHILSTVAMVVGATLYLGDIRKDVEVLKVQQLAQNEQKRDIQAKLEKLDAKLDRLIEAKSMRLGSQPTQ
ncbi:MAG: hypothetical protein ACKOF9_04330 [Burkholderiales bacterium]